MQIIGRNIPGTKARLWRRGDLGGHRYFAWLPSSGHEKHALHKSCGRAKGVCGEIFLPCGDILNFPQESYISLLMKQHIILWRIIKEKTLGLKYSLGKKWLLWCTREQWTCRKGRWHTKTEEVVGHLEEKEVAPLHEPPPPPTTKQPPNISRQAGTIHPDHSGRKHCFFPFFLFQKRISLRDGRSAPWGLDPAEKQVAPPHWQGIQSVKPQGISRDASPSINSFCLLQQNWICPLELSTMKQNKKNTQILNYTPFFT